MAKPDKSSKASKKTNRRTNAPKAAFGSKSNFVRSQPSLSAAELVKLGKSQGIKLTPGHVYNIRATDKKKSKSGDATARPTRLAAVPDVAGPEVQLRTLMLRLGLDKVDEIFTEMKAGFVATMERPLASRRRSSSTASPTSNSRPATVPPPAPAQESAAQHSN
jgi:hypothetical protein